MGKRELLIAVAFVALGALAYRFTAPPAKTGTGFSLSRLFNNARRSIQEDTVQATDVEHGTIPASADLAELRVGKVTRLVRIIGESRHDIAYELTVDSTGPDKATALEWAKRAGLALDDLGTAMSMTVTYPDEGRQFSQLVLHVPARLTLRIDGSSGTGVEASDIKGLRLDDVRGDSTVKALTGALTGSYRAGTLTVAGAGLVTLAIVNATASFDDVRDRMTLTLRSGHCRITAPQGPVEADETNSELWIGHPRASTRISGSGGRLTVESPSQDLTIDARRAEVEVTAGGAAPISLITTDDTLRVNLPASAAVALDAAATEGGSIDASDFGLTPERARREERLLHEFGAANAPRLVLRNQRAEIVIRKTK